jgi:hypothetical protein
MGWILFLTWVFALQLNLVCFLGAKQKIVMGWCASLSWLDVNSLGLQIRINAVWFWLLCVWGRRGVRTQVLTQPNRLDRLEARDGYERGVPSWLTRNQYYAVRSVYTVQSL